MPYVPTIAVDFDNTLCDSKFPECGPPKPGAKEALEAFRAMGFRILIWTCRTCHFHYDVFGGDPEQPTLERPAVRLMIDWLNEQGIPYDEVDDGSRGKPLSDFYCDDKAIRVDNNWSEVVEFVRQHATKS